jgi:putative hydrolase of the HAD superfamily
LPRSRLRATALPDDLAMSPAGRFTSYREEDKSIGPGAYDAIDSLKALGVELALVTKGAADTQHTMLQRFGS